MIVTPGTEDVELVLVGAVLDAIFEGVDGAEDDLEKKYAMPMRIAAAIIMAAMI